MDKIIKLREHLKEAATKQSGEWLRTKLEEYIASGNIEPITIDFNNIDKFSSQFFNNSFSALVIKYKGSNFLSRFNRVNLSETGEFLYQSSINNALMLLENIDKREAMSEIVNNAPKKVNTYET